MFCQDTFEKKTAFEPWLEIVKSFVRLWSCKSSLMCETLPKQLAGIELIQINAIPGTSPSINPLLTAEKRITV